MWYTNKELAANGGRPMRTKPWQDNLTLGEEERRAACGVIEGGYLSLFEGTHAAEAPFSFWGGPYVQRLEQAWCEYYGAAHAVSMNSATSGLTAAVGALGLGYGDEVIVSPYTMTASASCMLLYGALPIFADVRRDTGSLDPASIRARITPRTKAILVVHQFGIPADMDPIMAVAREHGIRVIEDCAQAHGAKYRGRFIGTIGDIGVFSLNVNKTIQIGEGGVCLTNDPDLHYRMALIRNHGEAVVEAAAYEAITNIVGFNFRLTEIAAAMAVEQLKKLDRLTALRRTYVQALSEVVSACPFLIPPPRCSHAAYGEAGCQTCYSTYYVYPFRFRPDACGLERREFAQLVEAEGIRLGQGYVRPLYLQPLYQRKQAFKHGYPFTAPANQAIRTNYEPGACPVAEQLYAREMLINEHVRPPQSLNDVMDIARAIEKVASCLCP